MILQVDSRQQKDKHKLKHDYFESQGYKLVVSKLLVGDYVIPSNGSVVVDTKKDMSEIYTDIIQQHERFKNECVLAQEAGIKLYVLIENTNGITCLDDVNKTKDGKYLWTNPQQYIWIKRGRKGKPPVSNATLKKSMITMQEKYGVEFVFCTPEDAGRTVISLLTANE